MIKCYREELENLNYKKILIIDDEDEILLLLKTVLSKEGFTNIKTLNNSIEAIQVCKEYNPDIIILDIMMPKVNGLELIKEIRKFSEVTVLFLSAKDDEIDKILGLELGADDYITKPFSTKEVLFRIKAHLRRIDRIQNEMVKNKNIIETLDFIIDLNSAEIQRENKRIFLRAKELNLLRLFVLNKNMILSKDQIIKSVWDEVPYGYENTLMVHIRKLREKLEKNPSEPKYILTIKGIGYKFNI